jgi:hypothetical protein
MLDSEWQATVTKEAVTFNEQGHDDLNKMNILALEQNLQPLF